MSVLVLSCSLGRACMLSKEISKALYTCVFNMPF